MTNEDLRELIRIDRDKYGVLLGFVDDDISAVDIKDIHTPVKVGDYVIVTKQYVWDGKGFIYMPKGGLNEKDN